MAKKRTYADEAKTIMSKYKTRLGDKFDKGDVLAIEAMNNELQGLQRRQEIDKIKDTISRGNAEEISQLALALQGSPGGGPPQGLPGQGQPQGPSQGFQAAQNQGPQQPGLPQGGPSQSAGGQAPQAGGQPIFAKGGILPTYQGIEPYPSQLPDSNQVESQRLVNVVKGMIQNNPQIGQQLIAQGIDINDTQQLLGATSKLINDFPQEYQQATAGNAQADQLLGTVPEILSRYPTAESQAVLDARNAPQASGAGVDAITGATIPATPPGAGGIAGVGRGGVESNINFPQVQADEPLGRSNLLGEYDGVTAVDKLGLTIPGGAGTGGGATGGGGGGTGVGTTPGDFGDFGQNNLGGLAYQGPDGVADADPLPSIDNARVTGPMDSPGVQAAADALGRTPGQLDLGAGAGDALGGGAYNSRVPWIGAAAEGAAAIFGNQQIDFSGLPELKAAQVSPQEVSFAREREEVKRQQELANSQIRRAAKQGGSQASLVGNTIAGATGTQRVASTQFGQSIQQEGNVNAQIRNQANQFNAQSQNRVNQQNFERDREELLINQQRRDAQIGGVGNAISGYGSDLMSANQYDQMINMLSADNPNYDFTGGQDSKLRRFFQVSQPIQKTFLNTGDRAYGS